MRKALLFSTIVVLLSAAPLTLPAQEPEPRGEYKLPKHPRILMFKGEEAVLRKKLEADSVWKSVHTIILNDCTSMIGKPPVERIQIGRRLLDTSREALKRIFSLSYAYRMTGDRRYFERAEKELLAVSSFSDWNPSHFLDVAEMTMGAAIGYDWLFDELSEQSRLIIRTAIIEKGLKPSLDSRYDGFTRATHNWNQVCNAGISYGALAVFESVAPLAESLIKRAEESIRLPMKDYEPDGAYPEGFGYWGYGTTFNVLFISAWEKAFDNKFDVPENRAFLKTSSFILNMTGPTGMNFNFSDNGFGTGLHPAMFWLASRNGDLSSLYFENQLLESLKSARDRLLPAILIWGAGVDRSAIEPPGYLAWIGRGKNPVALMRTSWTEPDAIFVGLKGGSPSVNHAHMDVGSFVMESEGVRWAMDFGAQDYNSLESKGVNLWNMAQTSQRWEVFRYNNFVHNTLTINGKLQRVSGKADVMRSCERPGFTAASVNLTPVYGDQLVSAERGIAIVSGKYVVVRDELETGRSEAVIRWTMLTPAEAEIAGPTSAELLKDGKRLHIKVESDWPIVKKSWTTEPTHPYDAPNPGTIRVGFEAKVPAGKKAVFLVYLVPGSSTDSFPEDPGSILSWNLK